MNIYLSKIINLLDSFDESFSSLSIIRQEILNVLNKKLVEESFILEKLLAIYVNNNKTLLKEFIFLVIEGLDVKSIATTSSMSYQLTPFINFYNNKSSASQTIDALQKSLPLLQGKGLISLILENNKLTLEIINRGLLDDLCKMNFVGYLKIAQHLVEKSKLKEKSEIFMGLIYKKTFMTDEVFELFMKDFDVVFAMEKNNNFFYNLLIFCKERNKVLPSKTFLDFVNVSNFSLLSKNKKFIESFFFNYNFKLDNEPYNKIVFDLINRPRDIPYLEKNIRINNNIKLLHDIFIAKALKIKKNNENITIKEEDVLNINKKNLSFLFREVKDNLNKDFVDQNIINELILLSIFFNTTKDDKFSNVFENFLDYEGFLNKKFKVFIDKLLFVNNLEVKIRDSFDKVGDVLKESSDGFFIYCFSNLMRDEKFSFVVRNIEAVNSILNLINGNNKYFNINDTLSLNVSNILNVKKEHKEKIINCYLENKMTHLFSENELKEFLQQNLSIQSTKNILEKYPFLFNSMKKIDKNNIVLCNFVLKNYDLKLDSIGNVLKNFLCLKNNNYKKIINDFASDNKKKSLFSFFKKNELKTLQDKINNLVLKEDARMLNVKEVKSLSLNKKDSKIFIELLTYIDNLGLENLNDYDNVLLKNKIEKCLFNSDNVNFAELEALLSNMIVKIESEVKNKISQEHAVIELKTSKSKLR